MLEKLDKYANHTTLFVHPKPGGNIDSLKELDVEKNGGDNKNVIAQAKTFGRQPKEAIKSWRERGYNVLGFNEKKYKDK